jgi:hypothetical protein
VKHFLNKSTAIYRRIFHASTADEMKLKNSRLSQNDTDMTLGKIAWGTILLLLFFLIFVTEMSVELQNKEKGSLPDTPDISK